MLKVDTQFEPQLTIKLIIYYYHSRNEMKEWKYPEEEKKVKTEFDRRGDEYRNTNHEIQKKWNAKNQIEEFMPRALSCFTFNDPRRNGLWQNLYTFEYKI